MSILLSGEAKRRLIVTSQFGVVQRICNSLKPATSTKIMLEHKWLSVGRGLCPQWVMLRSNIKTPYLHCTKNIMWWRFNLIKKIFFSKSYLCRCWEFIIKRASLISVDAACCVLFLVEQNCKGRVVTLQATIGYHHEKIQIRYLLLRSLVLTTIVGFRSEYVWIMPLIL